MSRILEALQKARQQQVSGVPELPNIEDIIDTRTTVAASTLRAGDALNAETLDVLESLNDGSSLLANCQRRDWKVNGNNLLFLAGETHAAGQEQFRTLRSRLYQLRGTGSLEVLVISSAIPGEGKSFVSANLAHAFALQSGRRALLIDADLRRAGGLSTFLEVPSSPGLTDYLLGQQNVESIIQKGSLDNLYLIPCGKRVSKPGELIGSPHFRTLIEQLRPAFDWIIIDTPPVVPISDAPLIADLSDGVLIVVNSRSTLAHLAKRAVQQFRPESLLGVVLNRTTEPSASYYSDYGYGYGAEEEVVTST
jgi:capsular exopolysaccharide synthesis family protein